MSDNMSIGSASSGSNVSGVSDTDKSTWNDKDHWAVTDFFHRFMPKVTKDVSAVGNDVYGGFEKVKKLAGDAVDGVKDFESAVKSTSFKAVIEKMVKNEENHDSLFNGILSKTHLKAISDDAKALHGSLDQLEKDAIPLEADIKTAIANGSKMIGSVKDIIAQAMTIYGGGTPNVDKLVDDLNQIKNDLEAALQMNNAKVQASDGGKDKKDSGLNADLFVSSPGASASNLYVVDSMNPTQTNTDNDTRDHGRDGQQRHRHATRMLNKA